MTSTPAPPLTRPQLEALRVVAERGNTFAISAARTTALIARGYIVLNGNGSGAVLTDLGREAVSA